MQPIQSSNNQNQVTPIQKQFPDRKQQSAASFAEIQSGNAILPDDVVNVAATLTSNEDPFKPKTPSTAVTYAEMRALYKSFSGNMRFSTRA